MTTRVLEFYSGIGGLHLAFIRSKVSGTVVRAFDWDPVTCQVYDANHGPGINSKVDICKLSADDLVSLQADLWLLSPSCQPYTVLNPQAKGEADPRAKSFIHIIRNILPDLVARKAHPSRLLVENVAGFECSSTRQLLLEALRSLNYMTFECLLTPLQFGIPNSRSRYYLLAKMAPLTFPPKMSLAEDTVWKHIPGLAEDWNDPRDTDVLASSHVSEVRQYLDPVEDEAIGDDLAISDRTLHKWGRLFDIVLPSSRRTCCFTRGYTQLVQGAGSIIQMNEAVDTTAAFNQVLRAQASENSDPMQNFRSLRLRYFSPRELLRLLHFEPPGDPQTQPFVWPSNVTTKTKYRLIGNSVNVKVVTELIDFLFE